MQSALTHNLSFASGFSPVLIAEGRARAVSTAFPPMQKPLKRLKDNVRFGRPAEAGG